MAEDRYNIYRSTVHWRYAMARQHLLFFDARLIFFIALFGLCARRSSGHSGPLCRTHD